MKKFIIGFFRKSPVCTGFLLLLISCHFTGIKSLTQSWVEASEVFWDIIITYIVIAASFITWIVPDIEKKKRERSTWMMIFISVTVLTALAKIFSS